MLLLGGGVRRTEADAERESCWSRRTLRLGASDFLEDIEHKTFDFFWANANPKNGLVPDRYPTQIFCEPRRGGFGLTAYPIGVERGYIIACRSPRSGA